LQRERLRALSRAIPDSLRLLLFRLLVLQLDQT